MRYYVYYCYYTDYGDGLGEGPRLEEFESYQLAEDFVRNVTGKQGYSKVIGPLLFN